MSAAEATYWNGEFTDAELDAIADEGVKLWLDTMLREVFAKHDAENDSQFNP